MLLRSCVAGAAMACAMPISAETPLRLAEASRLLYDAGVEAEDALLVIAAAKLRRSLLLQRNEASLEKDDAVSARAMIETARALAQGDAALMAVVEDVASVADRGVINGPVYNITQIGARVTDSYDDIPFRGREYAEVYVEAQDSSDLNLRIFDDADRLVCSDTDISAIAYCGWQPREDGVFRVEVENASAVTVTYNLMSN